MSSLSSFRDNAKSASDDLVTKSAEKISTLQTTYAEYFSAPSLSAVQTEYAALNESPNTKLIAAVNTTLDVTDTVLNDLATLEQYITLSLPKVEDGGNFGVTIQMGGLKIISDAKEKLEKQSEELSKYFSARADALEKCKLPTVSKTSSKTTSSSSSEGTTTEKGEQKSSESKTFTEDKETTSSTVPDGVEAAYRKQAVVAVDVTYYQKTKSLFRTTVLTLAAALDYAEKNSAKISQPKGSQGGSSGYSSMY